MNSKNMDKEHISGIQIDGCSLVGNGVAVSVPKNSNVNIRNTSMINNGIGLEIRDDVSTLFDVLKTEILGSRLDSSSKERLMKQIIDSINTGKFTEEKKNRIVPILKAIGEKAVDLFIQIAANYITK
jgi:hypothetical protein